MKFNIQLAVTIFFLLAFFPSTVLAASDTDSKPEVKMTDDGKIQWKTIDTKATTGIKWKTEGFTVKAYKVLTSALSGTKEYGNPIYKKPYGKFTNKSEYYQLDRVSNGKYYGTWTIPKTVVTKQIQNAGVNATTLKKEGGYLYLNGFFRTYHNGKVYSKYIYDLDGIKKAEAWRNPNDFKDRFDIPVEYKAEKVPVRIVYEEAYDGELHKVKTRNLSKQTPLTEFYAKDSGVTLSELLPAKISSKYRKNQSVWAYKVTIQNATTGKTLSFPVSSGSSKKVNKLVFQYNPVLSSATYSSYMKEFQAFRNRGWEVPYGGLQITISYKYYKKIVNQDPNTKEIRDDFTDPQGVNQTFKGVIGSNQKGKELFHVEEGIPTLEKTYTYVVGQSYLISYTFTNYYGKNQYFKITSSGTEIVNKSYSYWKVTQLDVYIIDSAIVKNYALPNKKVILERNNKYQVPKVVLKKTAGMKEPTSGGSTVADIQVQNDYLEVDGKVLMENGWCQASTKKPVRMSRPSVITHHVLKKEGMIIDRDKENGEWESSSSIIYKRIHSYGESQGSQLVFDVETNDVVIHTPTVCDAQIEDVRAYNQMLDPDNGSAGLVLDRFFEVDLPTTGTHNQYKNYGYRDYSKYIARRQVKFPFDVFLDEEYQKANTWITLTGDKTTFYLPSWVEEGYYVAEFRAIAVNSDANNGSEQQEELANYQLENYVAVDTVDIQVSGRLYGFQIYDVTDYPLWQSVFRMKDSMKPTGNYYSVGRNDRNGETTAQSEKMTLPLIPGSHPTSPSEGAIPTGYAIRFSIQTMGSMDGEKDLVQCIPKFYYVSKDGTKREEVDLYYDETINGEKKHLIQVGSEEDGNNIKKMYLGNLYTSVPEEEITETANLLKIPMEQLKYTVSPSYTFQKIQLLSTQRTFVGNTKFSSIPVSQDRIKCSIQKWYGEYYLPASVHAVSKGISVEEYAKEQMISYNESFWKTDGYIVVQFDITTIQDGTPHLNYKNVNHFPDGYCNMWKMEGYSNQKYDYQNTLFTLQDGDILFYELERSVADDYVVGGTH